MASSSQELTTPDIQQIDLRTFASRQAVIETVNGLIKRAKELQAAASELGSDPIYIEISGFTLGSKQCEEYFADLLKAIKTNKRALLGVERIMLNEFCFEPKNYWETLLFHVEDLKTLLKRIHIVHIEDAKHAFVRSINKYVLPQYNDSIFKVTLYPFSPNSQDEKKSSPVASATDAASSPDRREKVDDSSAPRAKRKRETTEESKSKKQKVESESAAEQDGSEKKSKPKSDAAENDESAMDASAEGAPKTPQHVKPKVAKRSRFFITPLAELSAASIDEKIKRIIKDNFELGKLNISPLSVLNTICEAVFNGAIGYELIKKNLFKRIVSNIRKKHPDPTPKATRGLGDVPKELLSLANFIVKKIKQKKVNPRNLNTRVGELWKEYTDSSGKKIPLPAMTKRDIDAKGGLVFKVVAIAVYSGYVVPSNAKKLKKYIDENPTQLKEWFKHPKKLFAALPADIKQDPPVVPADEAVHKKGFVPFKCLQQHYKRGHSAQELDNESEYDPREEGQSADSDGSSSHAVLRPRKKSAAHSHSHEAVKSSSHSVLDIDGEEAESDTSQQESSTASSSDSQTPPRARVTFNARPARFQSNTLGILQKISNGSLAVSVSAPAPSASMAPPRNPSLFGATAALAASNADTPDAAPVDENAPDADAMPINTMDKKL